MSVDESRGVVRRVARRTTEKYPKVFGSGGQRGEQLSTPANRHGHSILTLVTFLPSSDRTRARHGHHTAVPVGRHDRQRGIALIIALLSIAMLGILLADFHESTGTAYAIAASGRDQLRAEYMARSGVNLTRLLIAKEPEIRQTIAPITQAVFGRVPAKLPVWNLADSILKPFCNFAGARGLDAGVDLGAAEGLEGTEATCEIRSFAENAMINVNTPLHFQGDAGRRSIAMQLYSLMGGYQLQSRYDPLFNTRDRDGQITTRADILSALIDWWDFDTQRTNFDPGASAVTSSGSEDDSYSRLEDNYTVKNAPFDTIEEIRLVRGIGDDFWSTFVEPDPEDPRSRTVTIYGSGAVNVNEAPPQVLLARLCSFIPEQAICSDPAEAAKFVQLLGTARAMIPLPLFASPGDFVNFLQGRGSGRDLYPMLQTFLGADNPLLFRPVTIEGERLQEVASVFISSSAIMTIDVIGRSGCRRMDESGECIGGYRGVVRMNTVVNVDDRWTPPPPNPGSMPALGIFHYVRID